MLQLVSLVCLRQCGRIILGQRLRQGQKTFSNRSLVLLVAPIYISMGSQILNVTLCLACIRKTECDLSNSNASNFLSPLRISVEPALRLFQDPSNFLLCLLTPLDSCPRSPQTCFSTSNLDPTSTEIVLPISMKRLKLL